MSYLDAVPHVVDVVVVRVRHVLRHDGHPVHQSRLGRRIVAVRAAGSVTARVVDVLLGQVAAVRAVVVVVRSSAAARSRGRCRRGASCAPGTWLRDMRVSRFRRRGPHERRFLQFKTAPPMSRRLARCLSRLSVRRCNKISRTGTVSPTVTNPLHTDIPPPRPRIV